MNIDKTNILPYFKTIIINNINLTNTNIEMVIYVFMYYIIYIG